MLTRLRIRNFKRFDDIDIELGRTVVFIGPNNSGKSTALQALTLWDLGRQEWFARRTDGESPKKRPGVALNRRDLFAIPVPSAQELWKDLHVRVGRESEEGTRRTLNVRIDIEVEGLTGGIPWTCGFEFDYQNEESITCRPLRRPGQDSVKVEDVEWSEIPSAARDLQLTFLPPMSGLVSQEFLKQPGEIRFLIGQGQTAELLRNCCFLVWRDHREGWTRIVETMKTLFGGELLEPAYIPSRGEIQLRYRERGTELDLSAAGRGFHQTLLLLSYMEANPSSVVLLDEPDAHLEVLRQRDIFNRLADQAARRGAQVIAASHSEVMLNEAAGRGTIVAFVGKPHTLGGRSDRAQLLKSLQEIGWDKYYLAEQCRWVLFLEGSTDLAILKAFADRLDHPARDALQNVFFHPLGTNVPRYASQFFFGLKEAVPGLLGLALLDRVSHLPESRDDGLRFEAWSRREIENYLVTPASLGRWAAAQAPGDLFQSNLEALMAESIGEIEAALAKTLKPGPWSAELKVSDEFLPPVFSEFARRSGIVRPPAKGEYHLLAAYLEPSEIHEEVVAKLDRIAEVHRRAGHPA